MRNKTSARNLYPRPHSGRSALPRRPLAPPDGYQS